MKSLDNANSLYLIFNNVDVYIEENNENKYLIFASTDKNKEVLENYTELWDEIKDQIETISDVKPIKYEKDFIKLKFELHDDLYSNCWVYFSRRQQLLSTSLFT